MNLTILAVQEDEGPLIPCWQQPALHIGHFTLYAHGILLVLGSLVGAVVFLRYAEAFSLSKRKAMLLLVLLAPLGLLASHLAYSVFDEPSALFQLQGISSLGGILACFLGLSVHAFRHPKTGWQWFDAACYAAVSGALIARLGCFLAHDRMGLSTSISWLSPFSVKCSGSPHYDLALLEMIFLIIWLVAIIWLERRRSRPAEGMTFAVLAVFYGLLRVLLGLLRDTPERRFGLIPEQWLAVLLVAAGVLCWLMIKRSARTSTRA